MKLIRREVPQAFMPSFALFLRDLKAMGLTGQTDTGTAGTTSGAQQEDFSCLLLLLYQHGQDADIN